MSFSGREDLIDPFCHVCLILPKSEKRETERETEKKRERETGTTGF